MRAATIQRVLTFSEISAFRSCQRRHSNRYTLLRRPQEDAKAPRFGKYIHAALETLGTGGVPVEYFAGDRYEQVTAAALLSGYQGWWEHAPERYDTFAAEVPFECPLVNPDTGAESRTYTLGGKMDGLARDQRERVWVVEHKTTSDDITPGSDYWKRLAIDTQIAIYLLGAKALGYEPAGVLYDVVRKPALEPYKATPVELRKYTIPTKKNPESRLYASQRESDETPEEFHQRLLADIAERPDYYYQRQLLVRDEREQYESARDVWQTALAIREAERGGRAPRNPDACLRWGRPCEYFDACSGVASLDDDSRFRTATTQHEELQA